MPFNYQTGLPWILPEEAPLPSEVVLDGGILDKRRREALGALRAALVDRPDEFSPEEWRVVVATLAPPAGHLGRRPGTPAARFGLVTLARECFPHLSATAAVSKFRATGRVPHVARFIAEFRALELADVMDQRGGVRERLWQVLALGDAINVANAVGEGAAEQSKIAAVVVAAAKVLADMDGLRVTDKEVAQVLADSAVPDDEGAEPEGLARSLADKVGRVAADLRRRGGSMAVP